MRSHVSSMGNYHSLENLSLRLAKRMGHSRDCLISAGVEAGKAASVAAGKLKSYVNISEIADARRRGRCCRWRCRGGRGLWILDLSLRF
jgi:hypothetical protein